MSRFDSRNEKRPVSADAKSSAVQPRARFFVTGTDTNVGKTLACAWLVHHWQASYWKPIQTGSSKNGAENTAENTDGREIARLTQMPVENIYPSTYELSAPLSPHQAARLDDQTICLESFVVPDTSRALVIEGAGGVLVPLNDHHLMIDLIRKLHFPTLVVARTTLGTINHTLLTLESLRSRDIMVRGVILNGPPHPANRQAIEKYGNVPIIGELPPLCPLNANTLTQTAPPPPLESLL